MNDTDQQLIERLESRAERRSERREFFRTALGAGAVAAFGATAVTIGSRATAQATDNDAAILNFALNLEYLEAQFYSFAAFGTGLPNALLTPGSASTTTQGTVTGGRAVNFTDPLVAQYAREIAQDEVNHVTFLRAQLSTAAVAQPAIDIGSSATSAFSVAAQAAKIVAAGAAFDPYASDENFLQAAFLFEDVGVTAYRGASSLLSSKVYLEAAAGILAAEAYHASIIRTVLYSKGLQTPSLRTNTDAISNVRDAFDGSSDDDQGISATTIANSQLPALNGLSASNIVPTGQDGLAYGRATGPVLNIVYLSTLAVAKGGFFPNGVNGSINTSTAAA
ncbi:ferritin-like domain-containing protein [Sphingomonas sp. PAMC 26621]|uniref:ferritin-like domain-containing protein n=1 Tax=Sphingomonas sp. PAMC 26621 TaxID=1112213 RepID=UPI000314E1C5|nr:ferritin-like domain-containing protein [Sphingomonas sp. PAMC 26621]